MIELFKQATVSQITAALKMLRQCVDECPDDLWWELVVNLKFCQVVLHALFFTDLYLGKNPAEFREQSFHKQHPDFFGNYEELEDRIQVQVYTKPDICLYEQFVTDKAHQSVAGETKDSLEAPAEFEWLPMSRAEVYLCNIRHVQHHAADLSMHLNLQTGNGVRWVKVGAAD